MSNFAKTAAPSTRGVHDGHQNPHSHPVQAPLRLCESRFSASPRRPSLRWTTTRSHRSGHHRLRALHRIHHRHRKRMNRRSPTWTSRIRASLAGHRGYDQQPSSCVEGVSQQTRVTLPEDHYGLGDAARDDDSAHLKLQTTARHRRKLGETGCS